jgi:phosphate-selective porin OprO/OprP
MKPSRVIERSLATSLLLVGALSAGVSAAAEFKLDGGLRWDGEDDAWRIEFAGRVHIDSASYSDDLTPLASGTEVRRARPTLSVRIGEDWRLRFDYELGNYGSGWKNGYVEYRGLERWRLRGGNQLAPFGLEQQMSSNSMPMLERSLMQALTPEFENGFSANFRGDRMQFKAGVFSGNVTSNDARRAGGTAYTGRITFAPVDRNAFSIHLGASAERRTSLSDGELRFRTRPESYVADVRLVDTGVLNGAEALSTTGVEAAVVFRKCRVIGEQTRSQVDFTAAPGLEFSGGYAMFGCLVSGEGYRYNASSGGFNSTRKSGRVGVIELNLRRSHVDLVDGGVIGGSQDNWTLGGSWQITDSLRLLADYVDMDLKPNRNGLAESASAIQARIQVAF